MNFRAAATPVLALAAVSFGVAQEGRQPTFRAETTLIQIEVQVLGPRGKPIQDLTKDDFLLRENGKPQQIATFEFAGSQRGAEGSPRPAAPQPPSHPQQICLLTEATYGNFLPVYDAVRAFLQQPWQPGTMVSLSGMPFTGDRDEVLRTLELMRLHPNGRGSPGDSNWVPAFVPRSALEYERLQGPARYSARRQSLDPPPGRTRAGGLNPATFEKRLMVFQERLMLLGYLDLIRQLGLYPGRKTVILFSAGLDLSQENLDDLNHLASEALRNRVTFYTVYSRGLDPGLRNGLHALASHTGGKALVDWNDLSPIFDWVAEDSRNYYLLGYYPRGLAAEGRFRRIQVSLKRPGVKVRTEPGFYEPLPFGEWSQRQKELHLYRAVLTRDLSSDFNVMASCKVSRGPGGESLTQLFTAVSAAEFSARRRRGRDEITLSFTARAIDQRGNSADRYHSWSVTKIYKPDVLEAARADAASVLHDMQTLSLPPGSYEVKVAVRDDRTGRTGTATVAVTVPDVPEP